MPRRISALLSLVFLCACDPAATSDRFGGETGGEVEEDVPCSPLGWGEADWRLCDENQGVQFCERFDGEARFGSCEMSDDCEVGQTRGPELFPDNEQCAGRFEYCRDFGEGVSAWFKPHCATPIVLSFDDAPIEYTQFTGDTAVAAFAPGGSCTTTDWPTAATPWLVLDRDGNGKIEGGAELFGSGTELASGRRAHHGFEAVAELDENQDGVVDSQDPKFAELRMWADHDGDRRSQPDELERLSARGVEQLSVDFHEQVICDARGNCGKERAGFSFAAGGQSRQGELVDVYLPCW